MNQNEILVVPKGVPKSGRRWKASQNKRFSAIKKGPAYSTTWSKKIAQRTEAKSVKEYQSRIIEKRREEKIAERKRIEAKRRLKAANERESEIVQVVTNPAKIKRMKKKELRRLQKRDTSGVVTKKML